MSSMLPLGFKLASCQQLTAKGHEFASLTECNAWMVAQPVSMTAIAILVGMVMIPFVISVRKRSPIKN